MAIIQVPCRFCRSDAVTQDVCSSCGQRQHPPRPRTGRKRIGPCKHRHWSEGETRYVGGELKRQSRCLGCGISREVEACG